jgi:hypothetical protein
VQHGHVYVFGFDTSSVTFGCENGNLYLRFDDGSRLVLLGFTAEIGLGDLYLEMMDGAVVSGSDVAQAMSFVPDDFPLGDSPDLSPHALSLPHGPLSNAGAPHEVLLEHLSEIRALGEETLHPFGPLPEGDHRDIPLAFSGSGGVGQGYALAIPPQACDAPEADNAPAQSALLNNPFYETSALSSPIISPSLAAEYSLFGPDTGHVRGLSPGWGAAATDEIQDTGGQSAYGREADLLALEDLLDTSMPGLSPGVDSAPPAFAELFLPSAENVFMVRADSGAFLELDHTSISADAAADSGSDQLLLAFLHMGSF